MQNVNLSFSNPYPLYAELREQTPIYQDENGTWHLMRYKDALLMFTDNRFKRKSPVSLGYINKNSAATMFDNLISKWSLFNDPSEHTRWREILSHIINPRFIKDTKAFIEENAADLIAKFPRNAEFDFMQNFAYILPIRVINHLLGTSLDVATVRKWSFAIATAMDHGTLEELEEIEPTITAMLTYAQELILARELQPGDDWISELVRLKGPYNLSTDDIVSNCIFLLLAAHETLQLTMGLGLITLIKHPEQRILLKNNPALIPSAIEEILRFDSPWNKMCRWTHEPVAFDDVVIPANQLVVAMVNSANRDPSRFANPNTFDITRTNNRHLAFGQGIHLCHGALLARLELQIAFTKLLPLLDHITLYEDKFEWQHNTSLRYISNLMIRIQDHE